MLGEMLDVDSGTGTEGWSEFTDNDLGSALAEVSLGAISDSGSEMRRLPISAVIVSASPSHPLRSLSDFVGTIPKAPRATGITGSP